jgi:hypothetical protein
MVTEAVVPRRRRMPAHVQEVGEKLRELEPKIEALRIRNGIDGREGCHPP